MSKQSGSIPKAGKGYQPSSTSSTLTYVLVGLAVVVIAGLVIGGVVWNSQRNKGGVDEKVLTENASLIVGANDAGHTIDVFEDFMCPICGSFEKQSGQAIVRAVDDGKLRVRFHMLNFLDSRSPSGDYSSRAAGAAQCVATGEKPEVFLKFHSALFAQQPQEGGTSDHSNADLAKIAADQGASAATQKCIADGAKVSQAKQAAQASETQLAKATGGQVGTPTVLSAGAPLDVSDPNWLSTLLSAKAD
ncbi:DsbA family protein [Gordonia sp. TBRC 11910]|uniref:DsbA family protein n=1 Tax=Gordonia asplenii TaxID=2725283 RepID=A0A848KTP1_9ACTN|nr:DsbA family protein [Gordonia asplenii]NMO01860.1 DsbA family protein [Gordonia asplenii]